MAKPLQPSSKVHTHIGHDRSLCGVNPNRGHYNVVDFQNFFTAAEADQCGRCLEHLRRRGYNIKKLREQNRVPYERAAALGLPAHMLPA